MNLEVIGQSRGWKVGDRVGTTNKAWNPCSTLKVVAVKEGKYATVISAKDSKDRVYTGSSNVFFKIPVSLL